MDPMSSSGESDSGRGADRRRQKLEAAFARLPPEHRDVLRLAHTERLRMSSIAQRMG